MSVASEEQFSINSMIFRQGKDADSIYIVKSGEFELLSFSHQNGSN